MLGRFAEKRGRKIRDIHSTFSEVTERLAVLTCSTDVGSHLRDNQGGTLTKLDFNREAFLLEAHTRKVAAIEILHAAIDSGFDRGY